MKKEKVCPRCNNIKLIEHFVDVSGKQNPRGKYCQSCLTEMWKEDLQRALEIEASHIPKLKIMYGKYWKHYALPHDFGATLHQERDFCPYCGDKFIEAYVDHMDPLQLGGEDSIRNAVFCCPPCNAKKGSKLFLTWLKELKPKYRKVARDIYIDKHDHPPEDFKSGEPTERSDGLSYELTLDEDELPEDKITITINAEDLLNSPEIQKLIKEHNEMKTKKR